VATGSTVAEAWKAAATLREAGLRVSVWNARFIKPLDEEALRRIAESSRSVVTVEEGVRTGGFGQQVRDALATLGQPVPVKVVALPDAFIEHGPQPVLRAENGIDAAAIVAAVQADRVSTGRLV
jgi:1-deoxy-D-xylulose-5-phosphate synthase